jgi:pyruvate formate lyase activating enzyme
MKKAMLWHEEKKNIRCDLCGRRCLIPEGKLGFCLVRKNVENVLYSLNYGKLISINIDPIEKKPLFHFFPGSTALSIASAGCNFCCRFCCNFEISQVFRDRKLEEVVGTDYTPKQIVDLAIKNNCKAISYTYTEPTIFFEFAYYTAKLAKKKGLYNTFVTNGYMTPEAVRKISPFLDAATVDFKGSADPKFYKEFSLVPKVEPIFESLKEMKKRKIFIEITNLIVPKIGDNLKQFKKLATWVFNELGADTPFHIIRFFPTYKIRELPETPIETLEKCVNIAKEVGLNYVYLGNVFGSKYESSHCTKCNAVVVERLGYSVVSHLKKDKCPNCNTKLNFVV